MNSANPMRSTRAIWYLALLSIAASVSAYRGAEEASQFYGDYEGDAISETDGVTQPRDLRVQIGPHKKGFQITWTSITHRDDGTIKRKEYTIDFYPTRRDHLYSAGMREDMFGNPVPLDPLRGEPYVWAKIEGKTMTVHSMFVTETGGYEMQIYERTLTDTGLDLHYTRVRDGQLLRTIQGKLNRVK